MNAANASPPDDSRPLIVDVRTPEEFQGGHVQGAINLPLQVFAQQYAAVLTDKAQPIVVYCASGGRSGMAAGFLQQNGYRDVRNGINAATVAQQLGSTVVRG